MKVLKSQNDEFVFGQVRSLRKRFHERRAKRRQSMLRHHLDEGPSPQDSIDNGVKTILGRSHWLSAIEDLGGRDASVTYEGTSKCG